MVWQGKVVFIVAFMLFQILGGQIGIPLIFLTAKFSPRVTRHSIFLNFLGTYVLYSFSFTLLLYSGQIANHNPPFAFCLIQSGMVRAAPPMVAAAVLAFALHLNLSIRDLLSRNSGRQSWPYRNFVMLAGPYFIYFLAFIFTISIGAVNREEVQRYPYYCTVQSKSVINTTETVRAISLIAASVIQGWTSYLVYKQWKLVSMSTKIQTLGLPVLVRTFLLLCTTLLGLVTSIVFLAHEDGPITNIIIALQPLFVFLIFGSQEDLWRVWFRRESPVPYIGLRSSVASTDSANRLMRKGYMPVDLESSAPSRSIDRSSHPVLLE